jgi:hypothetical protein
MADEYRVRVTEGGNTPDELAGVIETIGDHNAEEAERIATEGGTVAEDISEQQAEDFKDDLEASGATAVVSPGEDE